MIRDRFEVLMNAIINGEEVSDPRNRFEELISLIAKKIGSGGDTPTSSIEEIPFEAGTGVENIRTFTFDKIPKFLAITCPSNNNAMTIVGYLIYGSPAYNVYQLSRTGGALSSGNIFEGHAGYSEDNLSVTLTGSSPVLGFNGTQAGKIIAFY